MEGGEVRAKAGLVGFGLSQVRFSDWCGGMGGFSWVVGFARFSGLGLMCGWRPDF